MSGARIQVRRVRGSDGDAFRWKDDISIAHTLRKLKSGGFLHTTDFGGGDVREENISSIQGVRMIERALDPDSGCQVDPHFLTLATIFHGAHLDFEEVGGSSLSPVCRPDCGHGTGRILTPDEKDEREFFDEISHMPPRA